jgi:hypothetical protein
MTEQRVPTDEVAGGFAPTGGAGGLAPPPRDSGGGAVLSALPP